MRVNTEHNTENSNTEYNTKNSELSKKPNFLIIIVDEQRYPPTYETDEIMEWRKNNLTAQNFLRSSGVDFRNHYTASTACAPARTSFYTGQYPSLHGVTQTDGAAKNAFDPGMFWLDPNTVPTLGDYLRVWGYETFWKGKWHASHADIIVPGTHDSYLSYNAHTGKPLKENENIYLNASKLDKYGFDGWVGPEPHGSSPLNSGASSSIGPSGRDELYSAQVVDLIKSLDKEKCSDTYTPWAIVASFINPHDIALFGAFTRLYPLFNFKIDDSVPYIPPSPTANEDLSTKPRAQKSYKEVYPKSLQPLADTEAYRKLYYSLQLKVDKEVEKVITALKNSTFFEDTIIIYTSDHGELLGSHGGLFQKWYQAYEEAIHVPLIIRDPRSASQKKSVDILTSHIDVLPTILGLAGIDEDKSLEILQKDHTEAHTLVGRNLSTLILDEGTCIHGNEPIYFMTDDDVSSGLDQTTFLGKPYESVVQPKHIETVIASLPTGENHGMEIWKYSRYFDNPQFWSTPGCEDRMNEGSLEEIEMYNLTLDSIEEYNLANPEFATIESKGIQMILAKILIRERNIKRIYPSNGNVQGKPSFNNCTENFSI